MQGNNEGRSSENRKPHTRTGLTALVLQFKTEK